MNTFYGEAGNSSSSLFDISVAGSTTALGRYYIK
jgi:DNA polymerase elongation subunit (family B)